MAGHRHADLEAVDLERPPLEHHPRACRDELLHAFCIGRDAHETSYAAGPQSGVTLRRIRTST